MFSKAILFFLSLCFSCQAAELLMVERVGCYYCAQWNKKIAPIYPKSDIGKQFPLMRMDLDKDKNHSFKFKSRVFYTPTFIILDKGVEIGRIEGFASEDFFWAKLEQFAK